MARRGVRLPSTSASTSRPRLSISSPKWIIILWVSKSCSSAYMLPAAAPLEKYSHNNDGGAAADAWNTNGGAAVILGRKVEVSGMLLPMYPCCNHNRSGTLSYLHCLPTILRGTFWPSLVRYGYPNTDDETEDEDGIVAKPSSAAQPRLLRNHHLGDLLDLHKSIAHPRSHLRNLLRLCL